MNAQNYDARALRNTAALMRERAQAATPGPWAVPVANVGRVIAPEAPHTNPPIGKTPPYPWRVVVEAGDGRHAEDTAAADSAHIASWHPAVALAVADWLEALARAIERSGVAHHPEPTSITERALAVVDAYLGDSR